MWIKTKVMRFSRHLSPIQIMIGKKYTEHVEYFNYLGSMMTDDARCTREIKCMVTTAKADFKKKKTFHQQTGFKFTEQT
jgi:hypothetical protein